MALLFYFTLHVFFVFQIVDMSLLVKQDQSPAATNPLSHTMPSVNHNLNESVNLATMAGNNTSQKLQGLASPTVVSNKFSECC